MVLHLNINQMKIKHRVFRTNVFFANLITSNMLMAAGAVLMC